MNDITLRHVSLVAVDLSGQVTRTQTRTLAFTRTPAYFRALAAFISELCAELPRQSVLGVGLSIPGIIGSGQDLVLRSHALSIQGLRADEFEQYLGLPCRMINDANAGCLAEAWADVSLRDAVYLSLSNSVGSAVLIGRRLYLGHNLRSGEDGLKIILMSELPSNAILARQFIQEFDGFSIGSNDMTQMVLATDRDNSSLSHIYDEEDPAVVWAILVTIFSGQKFGKKVGFCGQGVANSEVLRGLVAISGITSASVVPDTYYRTKQDFAAAEALNISASGLGKWLGEQHQAKLVKLLEAAGKADVAKLASDPAKKSEAKRS